MTDKQTKASLLKRAFSDPSALFERPAQVLADQRFTREQKHEILDRWEADARLLMVAEEENMAGGGVQASVPLRRIREALSALGKASTTPRSPTKLG